MFADELQNFNSITGASSAFKDISDIQERIKEFLFETLPKISKQLANALNRNEKSLSSEICVRLQSESEGRLFTFHNEMPENQKATRIMDIKSSPRTSERVYCGGRHYDVIDPLFDIEVKILPTPNCSKKKDDRSREYVVGSWNKKDIANKTHKGGVERFKEEHHSANLNQAALLALIKDNDFPYWQNNVNIWIQNLIDNPITSHQSSWCNSDKISLTKSNMLISEYQSLHSRVTKDPIKIQHLFLKLN